MKFIGISGGWKKTNTAVEEAVREAVSHIMAAGDGIVAGGALGVDFFAVDEAMKLDPAASRIKVFLPTTLERYAAHYRQRAGEEVVTPAQAEMLIGQLTRLKQTNPAAVIENPANEVVDKAAYFDRDTAVVNASDELLAFHVVSHVSDGPGTLDTISKARAKGIPISVREFNLSE
ncbi:MAG: hypothetical protein PHT12_04470 [Patescibacteria group bacterium]|nr:hypothetical protein [Patescibacteria group bacterium]